MRPNSASITKNQGIIGEGVELTVAHLNDIRPSTILYHLAAQLLFTKFRDPGDEPKMYLFSQLKRIAREWLDGGYLRCSGGTYRAQLIYQDIADRACERINAAIPSRWRATARSRSISSSGRCCNLGQSRSGGRGRSRSAIDRRLTPVEFRIADTFTASLCRLNAAEQKSVKTTAFDLQLNQANPGLRFHRLERRRDPNFWSVRVNGDIRLIVHRTPTSLLLCYVGHHDAYDWAERRRIERHPTTGAAQLVELPQRVEPLSGPMMGETRLVPIDEPSRTPPLLLLG